MNAPVKRRYAVVAVAVVFTALSGFSAFSTNEIARRSSEETLRSTAFFLGITLDQALHRTGIDEGLIAEIMKNQPWESIAYVALIDHDRKIVLHSNPRLIGQTWPQSEGITPGTAYVTLKTGELVYVMNMPVQIHGSTPMAMSIALHTYPAMEAVRGAQLHLIVLLVVNGAMWGLVFAFLYYMKKMDRMQLRAQEKERFTALGEMAAVLAHEIRTPLSAIKGFAQYIRQGHKETDSTAEGLDVIIKESLRLEGLTNDLLVYARAPELKTRQLFLGQLIDEAAAAANISDGIILEKHISLINDGINTDEEKLKQVLINIISNAADSETDKIYITVEGDKKMLTLTITDTGKGMDAAVLQEVWKPFFTTKARGTGLGLPIAANLVSALGGAISIESRIDQGTSVTIKLPLYKSSIAPA
ncbi:sensor histidine kinase [Candidatus Magnetominusculus xianensis]|uniref:histidine kinase n=1 Tax=Candidatus Magnetominusculus xianensis TaxID=1748249 RepID=A0ABR5SHS9_9BACT|nr:ATP-binding protein [Candidatus Magnetominusculus xianensis]KWT91784.1 two-component system sensor histidine kinase [Candidatus Magnetominusculus xianensis]MBF0404840.1 ATP-binding protein [Nitrospirota bacterium]